MSKQYAHLHAMAKTSVKFQNDWQKTVGGVALTSQLLMNGQTDRRVTARLYRTCVLTQVRQKLIRLSKHYSNVDLSPSWKHATLSLLVLLLINFIVPLNRSFVISLISNGTKKKLWSL